MRSAGAVLRRAQFGRGGMYAGNDRSNSRARAENAHLCVCLENLARKLNFAGLHHGSRIPRRCCATGYRLGRRARSCPAARQACLRCATNIRRRAAATPQPRHSRATDVEHTPVLATRYNAVGPRTVVAPQHALTTHTAALLTTDRTRTVAPPLVVS